MRRIIACIPLMLPMAAFGPAAAQGLDAGKTITLTAGQWSVERSADKMTDAINCVGFHKARRGIQLSADTMFVTVKGGIQSVTIRTDETPPSPMRLALDLEKSINSVLLRGSEFASVTKSDRLRIQVLTLVSGVFNEDIDIRGIQDAVPHIKAKCPIGAPIQPAPTTSAATRCDPVLMARLASANLSPPKIAEVCKM